MNQRPPVVPAGGDEAATRRNVAGGAGITLIGAVVGGGLLLLNEIIAARFLGVTAYGFYALAYAFARIGEITSLFGLRATLLRFLPLFRQERRPDKVAGVIYAALALPLVISGTLAVVLWQGAEAITGGLFDKAYSAIFLVVLAFAVPFMALSEIIGHITRGFGRTAPYVVSRNLVPPVVFMLLLLTIGTLDAAPQWVAGSFLIAQLCGFLVACYTLARVVDAPVWQARPQMQAGALYRYALPVFFNTILYMVITWTDLLMIGHFLTADSLGIYRGCIQFTLVFEMMGLAFNAATGHVYPVMLEEEGRPRLRPLYATVVRWLTMLAFCGFIVIATNAPDLLALMGDDFVYGAPVLVILAVTGLIRSLGSSAGFMLVVGKRQTTESANVVLGAILNVILNLILIPRIGILGAAIATAVTMLLVAVLRLEEVRRIFGIGTPFAVVARNGLLLGLGGLAVAGLAELAGLGNGNGFVLLLARLVVTGLALAALGWFLLTDAHERELLTGLLRRRRAGGA